MKKVLAAVLMVAFAASTVIAADEVVMKAKNGDVKLNHKKHATAGSCKECHDSDAPAAGAKVTLGKDKAHKLCKGCHETKKAGPTKCGECHKK